MILNVSNILQDGCTAGIFIVILSCRNNYQWWMESSIDQYKPMHQINGMTNILHDQIIWKWIGRHLDIPLCYQVVTLAYPVCVQVVTLTYPVCDQVVTLTYPVFYRVVTLTYPVCYQVVTLTYPSVNRSSPWHTLSFIRSSPWHI